MGERSSRIYIGNLNPRATEADLEREFVRFGTIKDIWVARKPPGFAFIEYDDYRDAEDSVRDMNGVNVQGQRIRVEVSTRGKKGPNKPRFQPTTFDDEGPGGRGGARRSRSPPRRRSRSPPRRNDSRDRRRDSRERRRSKSRSRSRSLPARDRDRDARRGRSPSPAANGSKASNRDKSPMQDRSVSRSRSRSPARAAKSASRSRSPA